MQVLINDLLAFSRVGRLLREHVEVEAGELVAQALGNLSLVIEETGAEVTVDELPRVSGDVSLLTGVFQNLIGNALKFRGDAPPRIHVGRAGRRGPVGVLGRGQRHRDRAGVRRPDLRDLPAAAPEGRLPRHRDRPGHVPQDRRVPRRPDLAGSDAAEPPAGTTFRFTLPKLAPPPGEAPALDPAAEEPETTG